MSLWQQHNVAGCVRQILASVLPKPPYPGRAFLTTYQIAVELDRRFPQVTSALGFRSGGEGDGPFALTTYLARQLAQTAIDDPHGDIEIAFLDAKHLSEVSVDDSGRPMRATTNQSGEPTSMFRLRDRP